MKSVRLSPRASTFLRKTIRATEELDILLLLRQDPRRWWSAEQIAQTFALRLDVVVLSLEALAGRNLLDVRVGATLTYCFSPVHDGLLPTLDEIATNPPAARELVGMASPKGPRIPGA